MNGTKRNKAFTLVEMLVALAVFCLVIAGAGGAFTSILKTWTRQKNSFSLIENTRWAMEFMTNELRHADQSHLSVEADGARLRFRMDPEDANNSNIIQVEYNVSGSVLQRRWRWVSGGGGWGAYQELANLVVDNPSGNDLFSRAGGLVTIELTVRPLPAEPEGNANKNYTVRTKVRVRNKHN